MHLWNGSGNLLATQDMGNYGTDTYGWKTVNVNPISLDADYDTTVALELPIDSWYLSVFTGHFTECLTPTAGSGAGTVRAGGLLSH
jgi:hypothetical protein